RRERERYSWLRQQMPYNSSPSGRLVLKIDHYESGLRKHWADGRKQRVEECLGAFILQLEAVANSIKPRREKQEEQERDRLAWEDERAEALQRIREEEERIETLREQAAAWEESQRIRRFVDAVRLRQKRGTTTYVADAAWLRWATEQADRLDPL